MSRKTSNDTKTEPKPQRARRSAQPRKRPAPPVDEEAIPWAEIILETEQEQHTVDQTLSTIEKRDSAEPSYTPAASTGTPGLDAESWVDSQVGGPPFPVLATVLAGFFLLLEM
jgi:hypothetical protein